MFIALKIKAKSVYRGYDTEGKLLIEPMPSSDYIEKIIRSIAYYRSLTITSS